MSFVGLLAFALFVAGVISIALPSKEERGDE